MHRQCHNIIALFFDQRRNALSLRPDHQDRRLFIHAIPVIPGIFHIGASDPVSLILQGFQCLRKVSHHSHRYCISRTGAGFHRSGCQRSRVMSGDDHSIGSGTVRSSENRPQIVGILNAVQSDVKPFGVFLFLQQCFQRICGNFPYSGGNAIVCCAASQLIQTASGHFHDRKVQNFGFFPEFTVFQCGRNIQFLHGRRIVFQLTDHIFSVYDQRDSSPICARRVSSIFSLSG